MTWWNPYTWKAEKGAPPPHVYVRIVLDGPITGIFLEEPPAPWIKIEELDLELAAAVLPGKSLDWHTVPMAWREKLEVSPGGITLPWRQVKAFIRGI